MKCDLCGAPTEEKFLGTRLCPAHRQAADADREAFKNRERRSFEARVEAASHELMTAVQRPVTFEEWVAFFERHGFGPVPFEGGR